MIKTANKVAIVSFLAATLTATMSVANEERPYIPVRSNKYQTAVPEAQEIVRPLPGMALVIFLRPSAAAYRDYSTIYDDTEFVGNIGAQARFSYHAAPGKHLFTVIGETADFMDAELKEGHPLADFPQEGAVDRTNSVGSRIY
jgi:hypothetical protein